MGRVSILDWSSFLSSFGGPSWFNVRMNTWILENHCIKVRKDFKLYEFLCLLVISWIGCVAKKSVFFKKILFSLIVITLGFGIGMTIQKGARSRGGSMIEVYALLMLVGSKSYNLYIVNEGFKINTRFDVNQYLYLSER